MHKLATKFIKMLKNSKKMYRTQKIAQKKERDPHGHQSRAVSAQLNNGNFGIGTVPVLYYAQF